ncbi:MAG: PaaI family thioesterase [Wenzhouxiangellaceae bacterium]
MTYQPADPQYEQRVRDSFARQAVMHTLNISLTRVSPGAVELTMPFQQALTQQHGFIHAGVISTILDSACGYAAFSLMPSDAAVLSIEFKVNLLSPAIGERFRARGAVKKAGRTITVTEGELIAVRGEQEKLVATLVGTMMTVRGREGVQG